MRRLPFDISDLSFDEYYNQTNLDDGVFTQDKNVDEYGVNKNIHSAYVEATYQLTHGLVANVGVKYDNVNIDVNYNVNRGGTQGERSIDKTMYCPA